MFSKKVKDFRKKNTVRKITKQVKEYIIERDRVCIICKYDYITQFHHAYYWNQAVYTENRNDPDQLVWLCDNCHNILHFKWDNNYRQECIDYLLNYYNKIKFTEYVPNDSN